MPQDNEIYKFLKANNLTTKDEKSFLNEYSDSSKAKELFGFFQSNNLTTKDFNSFYDTYLKKKEPSASSATKLPSQKPIEITAGLTELPKEQKGFEEIKPTAKGVTQSIILMDKNDREVRKPILAGALQGKIANILSLGKTPTTEELGEIADLNRQLQEIPASEASQAWEKDGLGIFKNPKLGLEFLAETIGSSLTSLVVAGQRTVPAALGVGAAAGSAIPGIGTAVGLGTGLTSGLTTAGANISTSQKLLELMSESGVDIANKDSLVKAFSDEKKLAEMRSKALKYGLSIALFDVAAAGVAGKLISGAAGKSIAKKVAAGLGEAGIQSFGGGAGEAVGQLASTGKINWKDVAVESIASLATDLPDVVVGAGIERVKSSSSNKNLATQIAVLGKEAGVEDAKINLDRDLKNGVINETEYNEGLQFVEKAAIINDAIPETVQGEGRAKAIELIDERQRLEEEIAQREEQKKSIDKAFHKPLDEANKEITTRIEEINAEIEKIASKKQKGEPEQISQPIELSIDETTQTTEVPIQAETKVGEPKATTETIGTTEVTEEELPKDSLLKKLKEIKAPQKLIDNINSQARILGFKDASFKEWITNLGYYTEGTNDIHINPFASIMSLRKNSKDNTIIHEAVHLVTTDAINTYLTGDLSKIPLKAIDSLDYINDSFNKAQSNYKNIETPYGFTNLHEFVSEFISNPSFRQIVGRNLGSDKTALNKILDAIKDFVSIITGIEFKTNINIEQLDKINNEIESIYYKRETKQQKTTEAVSQEKVTVRRLSGEEPPMREGVRITTLSGMTEPERTSAIEQRKKETKVSDKVMQTNDLVMQAKSYFDKGARYANSAEGRDKLNQLRAKARDMGLEIDPTRNAVVKRNEKGRVTKVTYNSKAEGDAVIDETGKLLTDRDRAVQETFEELLDNDVFLDVMQENGTRMSAAQVDATIQDILNGIPSKRANRYLDMVEKAIAEDAFPLYDKTLGEVAPRLEDIRQQLGVEKETVGQPFDEESLLKYLEEESQLTPEEEAELLDNIENLLYEYEPIIEEGIETEVSEPQPTTETTVPQQTEQITEVKETKPTNTGETVEPPKPPKPPKETEGESEKPFIEKMRSFYKNVIERSKGMTDEQKELLKADPNALYTTLHSQESKKIAQEIIEELGVENAVLEATKKDTQLEPVERVMILGAAMDFYSGKAKEQALKGNEAKLKEMAENEIDAQEKMLEIAKELGGLGTAYGRAINIFKEIYKLSNFALERKLRNQVDKLNEIRSKEATDEAKGVSKIISEESETVKEVGEDLTETELMRNIDGARKIKELEQEVADLKKQILERDNAEKGSKKNPLKIKRVTNDTEYDKRVKEFRQRQRTGISKEDISDLTYFGLYHIENGITKFVDWVKVMNRNFKGFKDNLPEIYKSVRDKSIDNGADKTLFNADSEIVDVPNILGLQKLEIKKEKVKEKINQIKKQILEKDQKKKEGKINEVEDLELERLRENLSDLEELRDKYIPELDEDYAFERKREKFKDSLVKQIISLNEQINKGEKNKKSSVEKYEGDAKIEKLKKIRDDKRKIVDELDSLSEEEKKVISDAKKMANATKRAAIAKFNQEMANNPDRARALAPKIAAGRIRKDATSNLDMPSTKLEQTYLQKLVKTINQKAKEYYKEKKEKISNINDILAFAIANGRKDVEIWNRTKVEVEKQINADTNLTEEQKSEVKDFLEDYTASIFDTLLTENQKDKLIREKLIEDGFSKEKTVNGKVIKSVDWSKVIGNSKSIQEAKEKIKKLILELGFTESEAKQEINSILDSFDAKVLDKKTRDVNKFLNKGILNKVKTALGGSSVKKSKIQNLIEMNNKGMLDDAKIKDALADELGLIELTEADLSEIRRLSEIIDDDKIPFFIKRQFEEQMQYLFDKKGGNIMYLENREAVTNNRLSSAYNQIQNATGFFRTISTLLTVAVKTRNARGAALVYNRELMNSIADAKTILLRGRVSRGSAFSDLTIVTEGEPRVRYTEYGSGKFLGGKFLGKPLYVNVKGKPVDINILNQAYSKVKYVQRLLETVDTPSSSVISGLTQYWQISKQVDSFYPELSAKEKSKKVWDIMYSVDRGKLVFSAIRKLKRGGVDEPTNSEINRTINEIVERERNELLNKEFYTAIESVEPMAKDRLSNKGITSPTQEEILKESYRILGYDEPLDVVARGERQAGRETGKSSTFGITSVILIPVDAVQKRISNSLKKNDTKAGKAISNAADASFSQLFPFVNSIARWVEMQLELTPYGAVKGLLYKSGVARAFEGGDKTKLPSREYQELGDDYIIRSVLGATYTVLGMYGIGFVKEMLDDEEDMDKAVRGTLKEENYTQEKVKSVGKPKQSITIKGRNIPLQLLGNEGVVLGMYADFLKMKKDTAQEEKGILYISAMVGLNSILEATWFSNASKYGGIATSLMKGKEESYKPALGKIAGGFMGSQIPFNRGQVEMATLLNPQSRQSLDFGTNLLNQMSIVRAFSKDKPSFDYRGRTYEYGDIYSNSADGVVKMFTKSKYGDKIDDFLSKINFAATDAYRETREADNYKYAITTQDGTKRFMTLEEYYDFKLLTAKEFDRLIKEKYQKIDEAKIEVNGKLDELETIKFKKEMVSFLLNYSKSKAIKDIQKKTGVEEGDNYDKIIEDKIKQIEKKYKKFEILGDIMIGEVGE